jgi:hypothetical protein
MDETRKQVTSETYPGIMSQICSLSPLRGNRQQTEIRSMYSLWRPEVDYNSNSCVETFLLTQMPHMEVLQHKKQIIFQSSFSKFHKYKSFMFSFT